LPINFETLKLIDEHIKIVIETKCTEATTEIVFMFETYNNST